ncbi:glycosyl hydrolase family 76-domain-containing protein [Neurospora tetraspora]|uniref:Mannan endo-1,6-alpha-mannosidase n=1 Tax=Neurospora tetraspora TaxID=94610 RepID=A0AAE0MTW6_9PEZI|nr:glycosyl hydrolase family 76-domain-containing protein [Neurospora tetraspora]
MRWNVAACGLMGLLAQSATAITMDIDNDQSVKDAAATIAYGMMRYYTGNNTGDTPGNLPDPYYWWEAGAMFGALVDYWWITGDTSYVEVATQAIVHQASDTRDFMPANQSRTSSNDDVGFWTITAMMAAEDGFPDPPPDQPQWLALVQAVFNQMASRWDDLNCGGGLRWAINDFQTGKDYKNSISNGLFFNLGARLSRFTGNSSYGEWASRTWDWERSINLITDEYDVKDGAHFDVTTHVCRNDSGPHVWSYNIGVFLQGAAFMYNTTTGAEQETWKTRVDGLLGAVETKYLTNDTKIIKEWYCESGFEDRGHPYQCNIDQQTFKGYLLRWLSSTSQVAPFTYDRINSWIRSTAIAAAASCTGPVGAAAPQVDSGGIQPGFKGIDGTACGFKWTQSFDGWAGVGAQMNALSAVMYTLTHKGLGKAGKGPVTTAQGGTSKGDPGAGVTDPSSRGGLAALKPITAADRVGAGIVTAILAISIVGGSVFLTI